MQHLGSRLRKEFRPFIRREGVKRSLIRSSFLDRAQTSAKIFSSTFFQVPEQDVPLVVLPFAEDNVRYLIWFEIERYFIL